MHHHAPIVVDFGMNPQKVVFMKRINHNHII